MALPVTGDIIQWNFHHFIQKQLNLLVSPLLYFLTVSTYSPKLYNEENLTFFDHRNSFYLKKWMPYSIKRNFNIENIHLSDDNEIWEKSKLSN